MVIRVHNKHIRQVLAIFLSIAILASLAGCGLLNGLKKDDVVNVPAVEPLADVISANAVSPKFQVGNTVLTIGTSTVQELIEAGAVYQATDEVPTLSFLEDPFWERWLNFQYGTTRIQIVSRNFSDKVRPLTDMAITYVYIDGPIDPAYPIYMMAGLTNGGTLNSVEEAFGAPVRTSSNGDAVYYYYASTYGDENLTFRFDRDNSIIQGISVGLPIDLVTSTDEMTTEMANELADYLEDRFDGGFVPGFILDNENIADSVSVSYGEKTLTQIRVYTLSDPANTNMDNVNYVACSYQTTVTLNEKDRQKYMEARGVDLNESYTVYGAFALKGVCQENNSLRPVSYAVAAQTGHMYDTMRGTSDGDNVYDKSMTYMISDTHLSEDEAYASLFTEHDFPLTTYNVTKIAFTSTKSHSGNTTTGTASNPETTPEPEEPEEDPTPEPEPEPDAEPDTYELGAGTNLQMATISLPEQFPETSREVITSDAPENQLRLYFSDNVESVEYTYPGSMPELDPEYDPERWVDPILHDAVTISKDTPITYRQLDYNRVGDDESLTAISNLYIESGSMYIRVMATTDWMSRQDVEALVISLIDHITYNDTEEESTETETEKADDSTDSDTSEAEAAETTSD